MRQSVKKLNTMSCARCVRLHAKNMAQRVAVFGRQRPLFCRSIFAETVHGPLFFSTGSVGAIAGSPPLPQRLDPMRCTRAGGAQRATTALLGRRVLVLVACGMDQHTGKKLGSRRDLSSPATHIQQASASRRCRRWGAYNALRRKRGTSTDGAQRTGVRDVAASGLREATRTLSLVTQETDSAEVGSCSSPKKQLRILSSYHTSWSRWRRWC